MRRKYYQHFLFALLVILGSSGCASRFVDYGEGYSSKRQTNARYQHRQPKNVTVTYHKVDKGETMYSIAWQYGYDFRTIAGWNNIRAPYTIYPGQKLRVREPENKYTNAKPITKRPQKSKKSTSPVKSRPPTRVAQSNKNDEKIRWQWPTRGSVVSRFAAGDLTRQGIDIAGKKGQPVNAAATGRVVYSGNGLRGYGNLVIIKHNETYFSAYAHNDKIHVREDENVKSGQRIADMGNSGADKFMLHFEIRRNGKPANPLKYLPKKR